MAEINRNTIRAINDYYKDLRNGIDRSSWAAANQDIINLFPELAAEYEQWKQSNSNDNTSAADAAEQNNIDDAVDEVITNATDTVENQIRKDTDKNIDAINWDAALRALRKRRNYRDPSQGGVLRYPLESLTEHTDYLQIDIVQYKPVGTDGTRTENQRITNEYNLGYGIKIPETSIPIRTRGGGGRYTARYGNRRLGRASNNAARTRPQGLATRALKNDGTILLPIPSNLQDGNSVSFSDDKLNGVQAAAASAVGGAMNVDLMNPAATAEQLKKVGTQLERNVRGGAGDLDTIKGLALKQLTANALGIFGGNVTVNQLLARETGEIFNPNMELLFNGPTLRAFKFQFKLTPRSQAEAQQCKLIIRAFKRNMAPKTRGATGGTWFLRTPNVFEIRYRSGLRDHPFLHKFKQCFLTDVSVNYTGEGTYSTYEDATPTSMLLDLSFKELEPIYDTDYDAEAGLGGVGY